MNIRLIELLYFMFVRIPARLRGWLRRNHVRLHWGRGLNNFGDCLQPLIAKYYGMTPEYVPSTINADIILQGTILQWLDSNYAGIIAGSGADEKDLDFPLAKVVGVRGALTKARIRGAANDVVYGDPGLLMPFIKSYPKTGEYDLGIIPHFCDKNDGIIKRFIENNSELRIVVIDVLPHPLSVCEMLNRCKYIFSSSLHGLIIADAYDVPNLRFTISKNRINPNDSYKFDDYYSSFRKQERNNHVCIELTGYERWSDIKYKFVSNYDKVHSLMTELDRTLRECFDKIRMSKYGK